MELSIAMPVTFDRLKYLLITLDCLRYQTCGSDIFEVIVAVDGGEKLQRITSEIEQLKLPFSTAVITTPRPFGEIAHRNHARNGAILRASSNWIWVLDSDQLVENNAISCILAEKDRAIEEGIIPVFLQTIFNMRYTPDEWLRKYSKWDKKQYISFFSGIRAGDSAFSGYASLYDKSPGYTKLEQLQENMPVFHRKIFDALDGFDESFLGWGGNKHEFSMRLSGLSDAGLIQLRLLHNVRMYHQSHSRASRKSSSVYSKNRTLFSNKIISIQSKSNEWKKQIENVKQVISEIKEDIPLQRTKMSIITVGACEEIRNQISQNNHNNEIQFISTYHKGPKPPKSWEIMISTYDMSDVEALNLGASAAEGDCLILLDYRKKPQYKSVVAAYNKLLKLPGGTCAFMPNGCIAVSREAFFRSGGLPTSIQDTGKAFEFFANIVNKGRNNASIIKPSIEWRPTNPMKLNTIIGRAKPSVSLGIITYNRLRVLKQTINSLFKSLRPDLFDYNIVVSDDESSDGTVEYLKSLPVTVIENRRGGVAAQANRILSHFDGNVEYGFLANDDLLFSEGWEELYIHAIRKTGYSHFVFMDLNLEKRVVGNRLFPPKDIVPFEDGYMVNWAGRRIEGAFLTFDQKVIDVVGGMDAPRFKLFGHEHVDWTVRIKRAKLAPGAARWIHGCYDVLGSNEYIQLNLKDYKRSVKDSEIKKITGGQSTEWHFNSIEGDHKRIYLPLITQ